MELVFIYDRVNTIAEKIFFKNLKKVRVIGTLTIARLITNIRVVFPQIRQIEVFDTTNLFPQSLGTLLRRGSTVLLISYFFTHSFEVLESTAHFS